MESHLLTYSHEGEETPEERQAKTEGLENVVGGNSVTLVSSQPCEKGAIQSRSQCASKVLFPSKTTVKMASKEALLNHCPKGWESGAAGPLRPSLILRDS